MVAIIWLVAGVLLAAGEALSGDFFLLMLAGGALGTAGITAVIDPPLVVDAIIFAMLSVGLILGVRPVLLRRFGSPPEIPMGMAALPGRTAVVLEDVGEKSGLIKLGGEIWSARSMDWSETYEVGSTVTVANIDGATAVVWKGL